MIIPEKRIPEQEPENDPDDQQSQQDTHSDGIELVQETTTDTEPNIEALNTANKASEPAFTLDVSKGIAKKKKK